MPERPLTIAAYAAGASLAAVTLFYVFGPTFFLDDEAAHSSRASRKRGVVGLVNPANDCFINSVLQALAGLPELRIYLIREIHRRKLDGLELYDKIEPEDDETQQHQPENSGRKTTPEWKTLGLQQGLVTTGLKDVLDALNERPIYKKTVSAQSFIRVVELALRTRVSRTQQDAQEFFQVVAERLSDEHHAGRRVRRSVRRRTSLNHNLRKSAEAVQAIRRETTGPLDGLDSSLAPAEDNTPQGKCVQDDAENAGNSVKASGMPDTTRTRFTSENSSQSHENSELESSGFDNDVSIRQSGTPPPDTPIGRNGNAEDDAEIEPFTFPFEGKIESQVECEYCHFKPRPTISSFVSLTLHVPQTSHSTTLGECFDGMLKIEHIDDFTCDRCRLDHALLVNSRELSIAGLSTEKRAQLEEDQRKLQTALSSDPEAFPKDVKLPHLSTAPKRRISRHMRIAKFPRILAIHLSRSVWDNQSASSKNMAKVSFPETMPLGGLLDRKNYRLLGVVTHKGGHNSGHYESFRRQFLSPPYSTSASMGTEGIYSLRSSPVPSPHVSPAPSANSLPLRATLSHTSPSAREARRKPLHLPTSIPFDAIPTPGLPTPPQMMESAGRKRRPSASSAMSLPRRRSSRGPDRWWRISDEKIKECKTSELLGMQKEVYLLFYELMDASGNTTE